MKFDRASGILLHPTSLFGKYGIGDLGPAACRWVDWLEGTGCKLWQVLPLGPTGYGDSPYQCFSAFAGNPYLVSPELLLENDLLHSNDLIENVDNNPSKVDYGRFIPWKLNLLERAFSRFTSIKHHLKEDFDTFCQDNTSWLEDYSIFMAIKEARGGGPWEEWPEPIRKRAPQEIAVVCNSLASSIQRYKFYQYVFFKQWSALLAYARKKGISIIGDIPIFVANDSSDVWSHPNLFFLDEALKPSVVAGVPPDYFSPTGQMWGNPLYRWEAHKTSKYQWWLERLAATLKMVDIVRIDHFRGFAGYWEIPAENLTAEHGRWVPGPGGDFFQAVRARLGQDLPIIAEDLGVITPDVVSLRDQFSLPGMKVLQFAFSGPENPFLPHSHTQNCVVYTGTHDNDTSRGWFESATNQEKDFARRYLNCDGSEFAWDMIRAAWRSPAQMAIAPFQDLLALGSEARFNFPSKLGGNWEWRLAEKDLSVELQDRLKEMNWLYQR